MRLGDERYPEGLWKGIQEMRLNEIAKIKIKRKYGFGRKERKETLIFPKGYSKEESEENYEKITKKGIIYEVTLVGWIE